MANKIFNVPNHLKGKGQPQQATFGILVIDAY